MSEQELYMMQDERGKDEFSTQNQIKKHERLQQDINQFAGRQYKPFRKLFFRCDFKLN